MMSQFPVKKKKKQRLRLPSPPAPLAHPVRFPKVVLCLVEKRMGATRKAFLTTLARQRGFLVEDANSDRVTHVVSEGNSGDEVVEWLLKKGSRGIDVLGGCPVLLNTSWFTESMSAGRPAEIEPRHRLQVAAHAETLEARCQVPVYACQRRTLLAHRNQTLTEVLEDGASAEVERVKHSERYQAMKVFTKIFGVGVKTASRWYQEGLRTLADLQAHRAKLSKEQEVGLLHYDDLNTPVERSDAEAISQVVRDAVRQCLPGASVTLAGGFRRGKQTGHDVDLLLTHPTEGQEVGLLKKVISWLDKQGFLLYHSSRRNTFQALEDPELGSNSSASTMDHFERCLSIFCLHFPGGVQIGAGAQKPGGAVTGSGVSSFWKAVRVDLVVTPFSQFPFALLGWTGSKNFERDLRRYSKHEKKMALSNHALYHLEQKTFLTAASEEEISQHLDLEYVPPEERNS
ncbi:DNA-directed DNA/RNA polymerase mu isoform X4 [Podarcis raffonei]|uniref:DNA-directed DNA/RNA polymerase mu isoform X4 n=1 Tax=Podarcis raffonei TaxID=65483 RepID=UPI002329737B|nr:DNA-directed DNA/RNA polymerase mu isoform X4 [Podarcis raffonei]